MDDDTYTAYISLLVRYYITMNDREPDDLMYIIVSDGINPLPYIDMWSYDIQQPSEEELRQYNIDDVVNVNRIENNKNYVRQLRLPMLPNSAIATLTNLEEGMYVWDTTLKQFKVYNGVTWEQIL